MTIKYNSNVAHRYGTNAASVFEYLCNKITDCGFKANGKIWYRASATVISAALPCFSASQIRLATKKLVKGGLLIRREYNNTRYDRTYSYALTEFGLAVMEACGYDK